MLNDDDAIVMNKILGFLSDSQSLVERNDTTTNDEANRVDSIGVPKDENVQDMVDDSTKNTNKYKNKIEYDFWKMNTTWLLLANDDTSCGSNDGGMTCCEICDNVILDETSFEQLKMEVISSDFYQTKLSRGRTHGGINTIRRNDKATFLPHYSTMSVVKYPLLSNLIQFLESTIVQQLSSHFDFDISRTSVQLASYSPNSHGYVRHFDNNNNKHAPSEVGRRITAVYYLTDKTWNHAHGGQLRLFQSTNKYYDAIPKANRLVLFRSELVEHQVLPLSSSTPGNRIAITIWIYGTPKKIQQQQIRFPKSLPKTCKALPILDNNPIMKEDDKDLIVNGSIFVMIASYCDSETIPTILSLISNAQYPHRIYVGIVWQNERDDVNSIIIPDINGWNNYRYIQLPARDATGPMYARTLGQQLYRNETFYVQIDSHMRFRPNWDTYSLQLILQQPQTNKTILTTYPPPYTLNDTDTSWMDETRGTTLIPWKFDEDGILRQKGIISDKTHKHYLYAAGFHVSYAMPLLQECPYISLHHLFFGEELFMSCRLYTHGYTTISPPTTISYHLWSRNHRPNPHPLSTNLEEKEKNRGLILEMLSNPKHHLLGSQRSLSDYASAINVNFQTQSCTNNNDHIRSCVQNENERDELCVPMQNLLLKIIESQQTQSP